MYLSYYGLHREPFHITPDPAFLFESPSHREAYAAISYGVAQRKGFIAVTGEVGTGKTTILRAYLKTLDLTQMQTFYVYSPDLTFDELLRMLLVELGETPEEQSAPAMLRQIQWKLIQLYEQGRGMLLVIDEAQNMPVDTLEKLRTLSNLETTDDKLIQIVLVGQPEFDERLNLHQLRQLKQRIAVRATLRTLTAAESVAYVRHRFELAGGNFEGIFAPGAIRALLRHAKGSPRALNILCDNILLAGFGAEQRPIRAALVHEVARDLAGVRPAVQGRLRWASALAAALLVVALSAGWALWPSTQHAGAAAKGGLNVVHAEATPPLAASTPPTAPVAAPVAVATPAPEANAPEGLVSDPPREAAVAQVMPPQVKVEAVPADAPVVMAERTPAVPVMASAPVKSEPPAAGELLREVQPGENLTRLLTELYGYCDPALIRAVQARNPGLADANKILTGQELVFPTIAGVAPTGLAHAGTGS
jgi:general secretion pathway protein A